MRLTLAQCKALLAAWKRTDPDHIPFFAEAQAAMHTGGVVTLPSGFQRKCDRVGNYCNTQFQGWGARIALTALQKVLAAGFDARIFAHDEIVSLIPDDDHSTERALHMAEIMEGAGRALLSHDGPPLRVEPVLARRWDKGAKSKMVNGKLSVWDRA